MRTEGGDDSLSARGGLGDSQLRVGGVLRLWWWTLSSSIKIFRQKQDSTERCC